MEAMLIVALFGALAGLVTKSVERHVAAQFDARAVRDESRRLGLVEPTPVLAIEDAQPFVEGPPFERYRLGQWMGDEDSAP